MISPLVYSVMYYATEAITRTIVGLILKIYEWLHRRAIIERKPRKEEAVPSWGFFEVVNEAGVREYVWLGKVSKLKVSIPGLIGLPIKATRLEKPPTRLYFTFAEAASKKWFDEIEWLASQVEKAGGGVGAS